MKTGALLLVAIIVLLPVVSFSSPPSVNDREALVDLFLAKNGKTLHITAHQLDIRQSGDKTFQWASAVEEELRKAGWAPCAAPREVNIAVYVSGLTQNGVASGNTFVATMDHSGDFIAKRTLDNTETDYAAKVVKAVNQVIRETRIGRFLKLITG
jgi:hypothetical protein